MSMRVEAMRLQLAAAAVVATVLVPAAARGGPLLDGELSLDRPARPSLAVALASASSASADPSLDFDLLGKPPAVTAAADDPALRRRRSMLNLHQGVGLGLLGMQLATTAVGQLNYSDKYGANAPVTARYQATHKVLAYSTLAVFTVNGGIALFAPRDPHKRSQGFDRVTLHKIGMATAAVGMLAQGLIGYQTQSREGFVNQERYARAHLLVGYATLAAVAVAVGAIVL
jgi:hypothetical protein